MSGASQNKREQRGVIVMAARSFALHTTAHHVTVLMHQKQAHLLNVCGETRDHTLVPWCHSLVAPDDAIVEVGAHIGTTALVLASAERTVHAVEACRNTFRQLAANVLINDAPNLYVHHAALGAYKERGSTRTLHVLSEAGDDATLEGLSYTASARKEEVTMRCLDDLTLDLSVGSGRIGLLLVRVEGHELQVLRGAQKLLRQHQPKILFSCKDERFKPRLFRFINDLAYDMICVSGYPTLFLASPQPR